MCERCLAINGIADEIMALAPLMKSDCTDELVEESISKIPGLSETGFTVAHFHAMTMNDLAGLIAIRAARAVFLIDQEPCSIVLGTWGGMMLQTEQMGMMMHVPSMAEFLEILFGDAPGAEIENRDEE